LPGILYASKTFYDSRVPELEHFFKQQQEGELSTSADQQEQQGLTLFVL
jgi:hypothetical protein